MLVDAASGCLRVQNPAQLHRYRSVILTRDVRIRPERHLRIAMAKPLLPDFHRHAGPVHQRCVAGRNASDGPRVYDLRSPVGTVSDETH
jgi:hypothetical protein